MNSGTIDLVVTFDDLMLLDAALSDFNQHILAKKGWKQEMDTLDRAANLRRVILETAKMAIDYEDKTA